MKLKHFSIFFCISKKNSLIPLPFFGVHYLHLGYLKLWCVLYCNAVTRLNETDCQTEMSSCFVQFNQKFVSDTFTCILLKEVIKVKCSFIIHLSLVQTNIWFLVQWHSEITTMLSDISDNISYSNSDTNSACNKLLWLVNTVNI